MQPTQYSDSKRSHMCVVRHGRPKENSLVLSGLVIDPQAKFWCERELVRRGRIGNSGVCVVVEKRNEFLLKLTACCSQALIVERDIVLGFGILDKVREMQLGVLGCRSTVKPY